MQYKDNKYCKQYRPVPRERFTRGAINFFVSGSLEFWLNNFCKNLWAAKHASKFLHYYLMFSGAQNTLTNFCRNYLAKIGTEVVKLVKISPNWNQFSENTKFDAKYQ